ncbi:MAG: hypothetical protein O2960_23445 [Verrucomicrobia bacterium]|nr:hypothetical protein [Verrucomicrobiota bacterium]
MKLPNSSKRKSNYSHTKSERYIYNVAGGGLGYQAGASPAAVAYHPASQFTQSQYVTEVQYAPAYGSSETVERGFIPKHWVKNA